MTMPNVVYFIVGIFLVEILIPWNIGVIRSRSDDATAIDILMDTIRFSNIELITKSIMYVIAIIMYEIEQFSIYSAILFMAVGGVNLFYLQKGQPRQDLP